MMTPKQVALVQSSWQSVVPIKDQAAGLFYGKLFEMDPGLRPLFKGNLAEQGQKLTGMLDLIVTKLGELDELVPAAQDLARRHVDYGVKEEHYATVGAALLWTLSTGLGDAFTDEVREAWTA